MHGGAHLILTLAGALSAALALGFITHRLRLSPIVGYLLGSTSRSRPPDGGGGGGPASPNSAAVSGAWIAESRPPDIPRCVAGSRAMDADAYLSASGDGPRAASIISQMPCGAMVGPGMGADRTDCPRGMSGGLESMLWTTRP